MFLIVWSSSATINQYSVLSSQKSGDSIPNDSVSGDSNIKLRYPIRQKQPFQPQTPGDESPLYLNTPKNIKTQTEYDQNSNDYIIKNKIDTFNINPPDYVPFKDYLNYDFDQALKNYWKERAEAQTMSAEKKGIIPKIKIGGEVFDRIFGGSTIDIRPQGSAELIFGINSNKRLDPALNVKQQRITNFDFQEKIQMSVTAKIGDKINMGVNYNTEASFDFENKMKLAYEGKEDEIIKTIEAGNISLPLSSTLIPGSQSLFGFKTKLQFGKVFVTGIFSEQQSQAQTINVTGGAQVSTFTLKADQYEEYKHYFISQYFRDHYEQALAKLPMINSPIIITKIEVWLTNIGAATTENRNIVAFADVGEEKTERLNNRNNVFIKPGNRGIYYTSPSNHANTLYENFYKKVRDINTVSNYLSSKGFTGGKDYEKVESARKLTQNEYTFNSRLGFIALNTQLNADQVLAVAFQYKITGKDSVYQVGEFSDGGIAAPNALIVKLLKGTAVYTHLPVWDLMMKNVYALGAYQVNKDGFRLDILYTDNKLGVPTNFLNETKIKGHPLIRVMGLDRLNTQLDPYIDGIFDFIDGAAENGGTIQTSNGRVYFPVLEPFGKRMRDSINPDGNNKALADKYAYDSLYRMTKISAQQFPDKNKFTIQGRYKSVGGSEISLNAMNVPQGSVKVSVGGIQLQENVGFTVDYTLGRVKIIDEGVLNSGAPVQISLENNSLFSIQKKTLMGTRIDYAVNKELNLGATLLHLTERPLTQKVNIGEEPISNTIWGMDVNYQKESDFITKLISSLPFYNSKTASRVTMYGEFANLIPGHSKSIGQTGTSYIDDFEGSTSGIDLMTQGNWKLASTPEKQPDLFPEAAFSNDLRYGLNRAKLAWYSIDPLFQINSSITPPNIGKPQQSEPYARQVLETEVFPNKQTPNGQPVSLPVLNLSFYPSERGPYNYDVKNTTISAGINSNGTLIRPETRWGGIMRYMSTTDFESTNIEYLQFWMMDPFIKDKNDSISGQLYFNLGDISEDILKDGRKSYENGLPTTSDGIKNIDETVWGRVPTLQALVNTFDNNPASRSYQDVGLDGLSDDDEKAFFSGKDKNGNDNYLDQLRNTYGVNSTAYQNVSNDPSGDDYHYFRGTDFDNNNIGILDRYKNFNGMDGNSPTSEQTTESYPTAATNLPDIEDINRDNTLSETERYYQYKIDLDPGKMNVGENYITDYIDANVNLSNGTTSTTRWYQFKIPIKDPNKKIVGDIRDFSSIRFMRIFMKGFKKPIHCRFATLELIRSEWRKYSYELLGPGEYIPTDIINKTNFVVSSVNIEENGKKMPIPYVIPPDIQREINWGTTNLQQLNEQSLSLKVCDLIDGDARAIYKTSEIDVRKYKKLKMFVHEEAIAGNDNLNNGDLTAFIRLGTDFTNNYYEYEIPLSPTSIKSVTTDPNIIWPSGNNFDIAFSKLTDAKLQRNKKIYNQKSSTNGAQTASLTTPYDTLDGVNKITVLGVPNLSSIKVIVIGVRNPKKKKFGDSDDGLPKCAEIWVDELRLTDFDEKGGWAATGRINTALADLGNLSLAGNISTPNFGTIEQRMSQRQQNSIKAYDIATNLELGKFFPEKLGLRIPLHFDYSKTIASPQYNPLDPDIIFKDALNTYNSKAAQDSIKSLVQDYTVRKNINFSNVKKVKTSMTSKPHIYDVENFDFTYAFSELYHRDVDVEYNIEKSNKGAIGWNFMNNPKKVSPLVKLKFIPKTKYLSLIRDFNFYYFPKMLSFHTDIDRQYTQNLLRSKTPYSSEMPTFIKIFNWNRVYGLKWDLASSLHFDYQAQALSRIDEPPGSVSAYTQVQKKAIRDSIQKGGRITNFNQKFTFNYSIPVNKIPLLDWLSSQATYTGEYHWTAAPLSVSNLANTIENGNTKLLNVNANLINLYNKIPYLKKLNETNKQLNRTARPDEKYKNEGIAKSDEQKTKSEKAKIEKAKKDELRTKNKQQIKNLKSQIVDVKSEIKTDSVDLKTLSNQLSDVSGKHSKDSARLVVKIDNLKNKISKRKTKLTNLNSQISNLQTQLSADSSQTPQVNYLKEIMHASLRALMCIRNISVSYTNSNGILFPGFKPSPVALGNDWNLMAPGTGFILGDNHDIRNTAFKKNWITGDSTINTGYMVKSLSNLSLRSTIEPFTDFKIEVTAQRNSTLNSQSILRKDTSTIDNLNGKYFHEYSKIETGNFSISYFIFPTAFVKNNKDYSSKTFQQFFYNTYYVAQQLANKRFGSNYKRSDTITLAPNGTKYIYPDGYGLTSQEVMLPAFLAAYTGKKLSSSMDIFPKIPMPNWRLTYTGLTRMEFFKQYFSSITIGHSYQCTYTVGNYMTNALFVQGQDIRDALRNYIPQLDIGQITITEQFAPLINIDMVWINNILSKFEIRKSRNLALSFANNQLTEIKSSEIVIGGGYRIKNVVFYVKGISGGGKKKQLKSDINIKADVSIRTDQTILRALIQNSNLISTGQQVISINTSADYQLSERFTVRLFFDKIINNPFVSSVFPNSNTNFGLSLRFTLAQ